MAKVTAAQERALRFLYNRGGRGTIDQYGNMIVNGEKDPASPATWLRLVTFRFIASDGPHRIRITEAGRRWIRVS